MPFGNRNIYFREDLFSSVLSQFKIYHPSGKLLFNNLGIFQSLKLRILTEKILPISHKLNFTPNTLGCYRLKQHKVSHYIKKISKYETHALQETVRRRVNRTAISYLLCTLMVRVPTTFSVSCMLTPWQMTTKDRLSAGTMAVTLLVVIQPPSGDTMERDVVLAGFTFWPSICHFTSAAGFELAVVHVSGTWSPARASVDPEMVTWVGATGTEHISRSLSPLCKGCFLRGTSIWFGLSEGRRYF